MTGTLLVHQSSLCDGDYLRTITESVITVFGAITGAILESVITECGVMNGALFCINHRVRCDDWCTDTESVITACALMTGALLLNQS